MPAILEAKLRDRARRMGLKGDRANAYIYGTLQRQTNWRPKKKGGPLSQAYQNRR